MGKSRAWFTKTFRGLSRTPRVRHVPGSDSSFRGVGDAETIDGAFRNACGTWATLCGPFRWIDITGGPALYERAMRRVLPTLSTTPELPKTLETMLAENKRGVIDGKGFYEYEPGDASRWEALLHEHAWEVWRLQQRYYPLSPAKTQSFHSSAIAQVR